MKAETRASYGLALLMMVGIAAAMLAYGIFSASTASARSDVTSVVVSPETPGANSQITVDFNSDAVLTGPFELTVKFSDGFEIPATILRSQITLTAAEGGSQNPEFDVTTGANNELVLRFEDDLAIGNRHTLTFFGTAGIKNPSTASTDHSVTISEDNGLTSGNAGKVTISRTLALSPTEGPDGTVLTITGKAFTDGGTATAYLDKNSNKMLDADEPIIGASASTISGGWFTLEVTVDSPTFATGANLVNVRDGTGASAPENSTWKLTGSVTTDATAVTRGDPVVVSLSNFSPTGTVTKLTLGGGTNLVDGTDHPIHDTGSADVTVKVPLEALLGTQTLSVTVTDTDTTTETRSASIEIVRRGFAINVSPTTAVANQAITVNGNGFTGGGTVPANSITLGGVSVTHPAITIDDNGNLITTFSVPSGDTADPNGVLRRAGDHEIKVEDSGMRVGIVNIAVPAKTITLGPAESRRGSLVSVSGSGFSSLSTVTISHGAITVTTVTTDSAGNLPASTNFTVPSNAGIPSSNTVTATIAGASGSNLSATATHTVPGASISIDKSSVSSGETVIVSGLDFPGFVSVTTLNIGSISVLPAPAPATIGDGSFTAAVLVPGLSTGTQPLLVIAGGTTANLPITIVATPAVTSKATGAVFAGETTSGNLVRVWSFDNATQAWSFFDPRVAFAAANTYTTATTGDIVWVNVTARTTFQGQTLFPGWNLIVLG